MCLLVASAVPNATPNMSLAVTCAPHSVKDAEKILIDAMGHRAEGPSGVKPLSTSSVRGFFIALASQACHAG
jgi:hypothetical protein